jgi:hypothetical protein
MNASTSCSPLFVTIFALILGISPLSLADHVLIAGDVVERSTIDVNAGSAKGQLKLQFCFGAGVYGRSLTIVYKERNGSPEAHAAIRKFLELVRDLKITEFGDPQLINLLGLTLDRVGE